MKIILSPVADFTSDVPPKVIGDTIQYRGHTLDLSGLENDVVIEEDSPFRYKATKTNGEIQIVVPYLYDCRLAKDHQSTNWDDYTFTIEEGDCPCPIEYKQEAI